jgi:hypothetical protein
MKKLNFILAFLFLTIIFVSCDRKNETTDYLVKNNLTGRWNIKQTGQLNSQGGIDYTDYVNDTDCDADNIVFNNDLTYKQIDFSKVNDACVSQTISGTYKQDNHALTVTYTDDYNVVHKTNYTITALTYTNLEANFTDDSGQMKFIILTKQ